MGRDVSKCISSEIHGISNGSQEEIMMMTDGGVLILTLIG